MKLALAPCKDSTNYVKEDLDNAFFCKLLLIVLLLSTFQNVVFSSYYLS